MSLNWYFKILDQFHKERNTEKFYNTQGFQSLWSAVGEIVRTEEFQLKITELRHKYKIPKTGFIITTTTWSHPPDEWIHKSKTDFYMINCVRKDIRKMCVKYQLSFHDWGDVFESYLFYSRTFISPEPNSHNICYVVDLLTKKDSLGIQLSKDRINAYPACLMISPYASKRDVLNYIEDLYTTEIQPLQEKYKNPDSKIGKTRLKNKRIQKRNDIIYENQQLSLKELQQLIKRETNENMDEGHIAKIKSLENKKRKKV